MGTRADFYVGRGENAEWLGSIAYDGYPDGPRAVAILGSTNEASFRDRVIAAVAHDDGTKPEDGWPWPWDTSHTTDYAYAFDDGTVYISCFGCAWFKSGEVAFHDKSAVFPNMKDRKNVTLGHRSGMLILRG
jgi:hypothetical protein